LGCHLELAKKRKLEKKTTSNQEGVRSSSATSDVGNCRKGRKKEAVAALSIGKRKQKTQEKNFLLLKVGEKKTPSIQKGTVFHK